MSPENSTQDQPKTRRAGFQPGKSGNPKGKPKGCHNHSTRAVLALLDGEAQALTRKAVEMALGGDCVALRLCLERLAPPRKDSPVTLADLPEIVSPTDLPKATAAILAATARGEITPGEASTLTGLVEAHRRSMEASDLEARVRELEAAMQAKRR